MHFNVNFQVSKCPSTHKSRVLNKVSTTRHGYVLLESNWRNDTRPRRVVIDAVITVIACDDTELHDVEIADRAL